MRLGRLQTSHWHAAHKQLFFEKKSCKLSDLIDLEVVFNAQQNQELLDAYSPCTLLTDIIESNGKWVLSEGNQHHDLIDQFMVRIDQLDPIHDEAGAMNISRTRFSVVRHSQSSLHSGSTNSSTNSLVSGPLSSVNSSYSRNESKESLDSVCDCSSNYLTNEPLTESAPLTATNSNVQLVPLENSLASESVMNHCEDGHRSFVLDGNFEPNDPPPPASQTGHPQLSNRFSRAVSDLNQNTIRNHTHQLSVIPPIPNPSETESPSVIPDPSPGLIIELSSILDSNIFDFMGSNTTIPAWPVLDRSPPSEPLPNSNLAKRQRTLIDTHNSQSTLMMSSTDSFPTTTDLLLELSTESPVLSVQQIHYLLTTCFDSTFHTRIVDQVVDPDHVDLSGRALRALVHQVSLRQLSQVIHWMCASDSERMSPIEPDKLMQVHTNEPPAATRHSNITVGPGWPILSIAKLLMIVTIDWTSDVSGLFIGYVTQSWPPEIQIQLISMLVFNEAPSLAAQFIKCATWSWTLVQVSELISILDCTLQWSETHFTSVIHYYIDTILRDQYFIPTSAPPEEGEPAVITLSRDETTRLHFITALYQTSVAVHQFRLETLKSELAG